MNDTQAPEIPEELFDLIERMCTTHNTDGMCISHSPGRATIRRILTHPAVEQHFRQALAEEFRQKMGREVLDRVIDIIDSTVAERYAGTAIEAINALRTTTGEG